MSTVVLSPLQHKGAKQIKISFEYDVNLKLYVKKFKGVKWSQTYRAFYLPMSAENANNLFIYLRKKKHFVDYSALVDAKKNRKSKANHTAKEHLTVENSKRLASYKNYLQGLRLSESTINTYATFISYFLHDLKDRHLDMVDNEHIRVFIERLQKKKKYSISSHRQLIGALKHFAYLFSTVEFEPMNLQMPRKDKRLPVVLSQTEIISLLRATTNLKHKATLALLYSAGLRIGEVINLQISDIDINRRQIHIKSAKGRKDRYVVMAESTVILLQNYVHAYRPKTLFIEGRQDGKKYSATSIRSYLKKYCNAAGIHKKITPHCLRHSYATHLIENGVGLRHVQELLGHSKPETTMIYTHIAKKDLLSVRSPLDDAVQQFQMSAKAASKVSLAEGFNH